MLKIGKLRKASSESFRHRSQLAPKAFPFLHSRLLRRTPGCVETLHSCALAVKKPINLELARVNPALFAGLSLLAFLLAFPEQALELRVAMEANKIGVARGPV